MPQGTAARLDISRHIFIISRQGYRMGSLIRATVLRGYPELVHELGGDPEPYLARFGIPSVVEDPDHAFIPFAAYARLLEFTADDLRCPDFGLRMSAWRGLEILGPLAVIARNSPTLRDCVRALARYLYVHSPAFILKLAAQTTAKRPLVATLELTERGLPEITQAHEVGIALSVTIIRLLGGPGARPTAVWFMHDQQGTDAAYRAALGCPVRFGRATCGFELSARLAGRRIESADPEASRMAAKYLDLKYLPPTARLADRVAQLAHQLLPTGQCSVDAIASELAVHPRTLQRQLAAEGTRCQDVIDGERRMLAAKYLAKPGLELGQIAGLLGYTEQSALNRSCRRWFGKTPRQYRVELGRDRPRGRRKAGQSSSLACKLTCW